MAEGIMETIQKMAKMQENFDKCSICPKILPPGTPCNKYYDDKYGSQTICLDCTMKATVWYVKKMHGEKV